MNTPIVPMAAFRTLTGEALDGQLSDLLQRNDFTELVLFSDPTGAQLALVAVGAGRKFSSLAEVADLEIDGLRALCAVRPRDKDAAIEGFERRERELSQLEASLTARERYLEECELRIAEVGQALSEREAMIEQREQQLLSKERDFFRRGGEATRKDTEPAAPTQ